MKIQPISAAVALLATVLLLEGTAAAGSKLKHDISELTHVERLLLRLTHPEVYNALFPRSSSGKSKTSANLMDTNYSTFDFLNVDLPTLILQLGKSGNVLLPNIQYNYGFYYCFIGVCTGFNQEYDYGEPVLKNANLTNLNTKINSTHLDIEFIIPDAKIISEKFTMTDTDLVTNDVIFTRGLTVSIANYTIRITANLEMVEGVGLQLSNTSTPFRVDDFRWRYENATHTFPDGTAEEWGEVETQYAEDMNDYMEVYGGDFASYVETWLNCFLSNGRGGEECPDFVNDRLQRVNFVQLLQTIGLSIADNLEQSEKKSIIAENEEQTSLLPLLLPQFPFPSIKFILLELPTKIVQIGKFLTEFLYPEYTPITDYPLAYDFIRKNCSSGACRSIRENMALSEYTFGGFSDNLIEYDIQPSNFSFLLKTPNLFVNGDVFQHESTDLESGLKEVYNGFELTLVDSEFGISGDYELKEGVGLQVSNLDLTLRLGRLQMRIPEYYTVDNGETSEVQDLKIDIAYDVMDIWREVNENGVSFETRYEEYIKEVINAQLVD